MDNKVIFDIAFKGQEVTAVAKNIRYNQVLRTLANRGRGDENEDVEADDCGNTILSVEDFFSDDPDQPWQPLPEHSLQKSPCYPIIDKRGNLYHCKIHQYMESPYLDVIEHHCKYKEPELHKAEIARLMQ